MLDGSFHPLDNRSSVLGSDKKRTAIKDLQSPLIPVRFVPSGHWVSVTPGVRDMSLVTARAALEDWVSNDTQWPEPEPEAESGVRYNVTTDVGPPYIRSLSCREYFILSFLMLFVKMFHKELWDYFWQPWSGMLWLVSARSHKLSGDCRNFDKAGSQQSR